ncbi:hypothetical protein M8C21_023330 [Ambrosia artemisiifolia]|uniref:Uncharacterized protein n=1 Tax=Ambrosia artemisiifolia TaxID=4212 RepID=A0AAD5G943_AMBAR|nr:hypothetical protein M8C21_023330 [Ambrosia artemisiifolia]
MENHILHIIHVVRARQLQAANLICLLLAFVALKKRRNIDDDVEVEDSMSSLPEQSSNAKKIRSKKRKRKLEQQDKELYSKLINCIDSVANAIREGNKILERVFRREYTGGEIYKELELMGLELHEIPKAINYLADNQAKARALFSCPLRIRMDMLKYMMGAADSAYAVMRMGAQHVN